MTTFDKSHFDRLICDENPPSPLISEGVLYGELLFFSTKDRRDPVPIPEAIREELSFALIIGSLHHSGVFLYLFLLISVSDRTSILFLIDSPITRSHLKNDYMNFFNTMTKAVVDIRKEQMVVDAELHADQEQVLLENGSSQEDLWGINLYPDKSASEFIEYTSLINIRPSQNNASMEVEDDSIKIKIREIVFKLIKYDS